jgi:hypothetical protein
MLKFITQEFEKEVKECLNYIEEKESGRRGLNLDGDLDIFDLIDPEFDPENYEDILIDESYQITISPDESEEDISINLRELIDLLNETKNVELFDDVKCVSNKRCLVRVAPKSYTDMEMIEILFSKKEKVFGIDSNIDDVKFNCSLKKGVTLFGILVHFSDNYNEYCPSVLSTDLFIEVVPENILGWQKMELIVNSYIFELYATHGIKLYVDPRLDGSIEYVDEDEVLNKKFIFRPLLFGKGLAEAIKLFNNAEESFDNFDYSIIQYTKVIEFVSQTVIRQEITSKAQSKLMSTRALNPDANYIKELEKIFNDFKETYNSDRNALKLTIRTCCDISEIIGCAPKYMDKIINLNETLLKGKRNKAEVLDAAYDLLADCISDTRNFVSHAKANYTLKGKECPEEQKCEFVNMIRILAIQTIRWFSLTNEVSRIVID